MVKNEPIIFQLQNKEQSDLWRLHELFGVSPSDKPYKFKLPYRTDLLVKSPDKQWHISVDIKVNTKWYKNITIIKSTFAIDLELEKSITVLIKPSDDNYFAGWGRWFNWGQPMSPPWSSHQYEYDYREQRRMLVGVLSDPDYAHLKSETEIGNNFRAAQYEYCENLRVAPFEDLDCTFDETSNGFRKHQYAWCESLTQKPIEVNPVVRVRSNDFRQGQYRGTKFQ
jgi:hypothetical protein